MTNPILSKKTLEQVQDLIEINIDSSKGFADAAERCDGVELRPTFRALSAERASFASDLQRLVSRNDELPETSGSLKGSVHRWWMKVRDSLQDSDLSLLEEMERGEDSIKHCYERVIAEVSPSPIDLTLRDQHGKVLNGHDLVRSLRDEARARSKSA